MLRSIVNVTELLGDLLSIAVCMMLGAVVVTLFYNEPKMEELADANQALAAENQRLEQRLSNHKACFSNVGIINRLRGNFDECVND